MGDAFTPPPGDAESVKTAATGLGTIGSTLNTANTSTRTAVHAAVAEWHGPRSRDFAQAAAGIQAQITVASSTAAHVASLIQEFATAQKTCHDDVADYEAAAGRCQQTIDRVSKQDTSGSSDMELIHASQQVEHFKQLAEESKRALTRKAHSIAAEVDASTDLLVPGGHALSPAAIGRKVDAATGASPTSGPMTVANAWATLAKAQHVVPADAVKPNGDIDYEQFKNGEDKGDDGSGELGSHTWSSLKTLLTKDYWLPDPTKVWDPTKGTWQNVQSMLTSDEFGAVPLGLAAELVKRYRNTPLVVPTTEAAATKLASFASELRETDPYFQRPNGLWVPKGTSVDPLAQDLQALSESKGFSTPGEPFLTGEPEGMPGGVPTWAKGASRGLFVVGAAATLYGTGSEQWAYDAEHHPDWSTTHKVLDTAQETTVVGGSSVAGAWAGAEVGAEAGAAIGSFFPGPGTVVGGVVGGLIGGFVGSKAGHAVGEGLESAGHSVAHAASSAWHSVFG